MIILRILLGLAITAVGFLMVWKTDVFFRLIGYIDFAERVFFGGSRMFYKLVGIILIFIGALVTVGLQDNLLEFLFGGIVNR